MSGELISWFDGLSLSVSTHSRSEQNAAFLLNRQNEFKRAAMSAKASGNIELAKKYLRMAKVIVEIVLSPTLDYKKKKKISHRH